MTAGKTAPNSSSKEQAPMTVEKARGRESVRLKRRVARNTRHDKPGKTGSASSNKPTGKIAHFRRGI